MEIPLVPPSDGLANANAIGTIAPGLDGKKGRRPLWQADTRPLQRNHGEVRMRAWTLAALASTALVAMMTPASAAWRGYISHPLGFAFAAPGQLNVENGTYKAAVGGTHEPPIFPSVDDTIAYKAIAIHAPAQAHNP